MSYKTSAYIVQTFNNNGDLIIKNTLTQKILKSNKEDVCKVKRALNKDYSEIGSLEGIEKNII